MNSRAFIEITFWGLTPGPIPMLYYIIVEKLGMGLGMRLLRTCTQSVCAFVCLVVSELHISIPLQKEQANIRTLPLARHQRSFQCSSVSRAFLFKP